MGNTLHVYVKDEQWEFFSRIVIYGKESETECAIILREDPLSSRCAGGMREAGSDCTHGSQNQRCQSCLSVPFVREKLVGEPPVTVDLSFCLAALHDVSYVLVFSVMELTT